MTDAGRIPLAEDHESWVLIRAALTSWLQSQSHIGSTEAGIVDVVAAETADYYRSLGSLITYVGQDPDRRLGHVLGNLVRLAGGGVLVQTVNHNAMVPDAEWLTEFDVLEEVVGHILNNPDAQPPIG